MNDIADIPNGIYTDTVLPAVGSNPGSAVIAHVLNPFSKSAYINSIALKPGASIANAADNGNTWNLNVQLEAGTEIANKDLLSNNGPLAVGTDYAFTISGNAAQRLVATGHGLLVYEEDIGSAPAIVNGHVVRIHWLPRG